MTAPRTLRLPGCERVSTRRTGAGLVARRASDSAAGPRDDYLEPCIRCALGEIVHAVGGAVGRNDAHIGLDPQFLEHLGSAGHGFPVGLAAHHDRDFGSPVRHAHISFR